MTDELQLLRYEIEALKVALENKTSTTMTPPSSLPSDVESILRDSWEENKMEKRDISHILDHYLTFDHPPLCDPSQCDPLFEHELKNKISITGATLNRELRSTQINFSHVARLLVGQIL
ncbi:hypothetical protein HMI54_010975 [Coelomomyces lativittatus]|nr:hypothetical protein HMI54_010975 [Coelomomyces lativittatus]KAJ1502484.1 hypothetical protein HMI56_002664 [Coelomomyces lativittatus]